MSSNRNSLDPESSNNGFDSHANTTQYILLDEPLKLPVAEGHRWIVDGFALFWKDPFTIIASSLVFLIGWFLISVVPLLSMLSCIVTVVCYAGLCYGFQQLEQGDRYSINCLFVGLKRHTRKLVLLGVFYLISMMFLSVIAIVIMGALLGPEILKVIMQIVTEIAEAPMTADQIHENFLNTFGEDELSLILLKVNLALLVCLAFFIPIFMGILFSPLLVIFHGIEPFDAIKRSFRACVFNFWAITWWNIVLSLILLIIGIFTFFIGWVIALPLILTSIYIAYKRIFLSLSNSQQTVVMA